MAESKQAHCQQRERGLEDGEDVCEVVDGLEEARHRGKRLAGGSALGCVLGKSDRQRRGESCAARCLSEKAWEANAVIFRDRG